MITVVEYSSYTIQPLPQLQGIRPDKQIEHNNTKTNGSLQKYIFFGKVKSSYSKSITRLSIESTTTFRAFAPYGQKKNYRYPM